MSKIVQQKLENQQQKFEIEQLQKQLQQLEFQMQQPSSSQHQQHPHCPSGVTMADDWAVWDPSDINEAGVPLKITDKFGRIYSYAGEKVTTNELRWKIWIGGKSAASTYKYRFSDHIKNGDSYIIFN